MEALMSNWLKYGSLTLTLFALLGTTSAMAREGGGGTGGGQGIVCRNSDGSVASAELLDLAEAEGYFLLNLEKHSEKRPYLDIAREYARRLDGAMPNATPMGTWSTKVDGKPQASGYEVNIAMLGAHADGYRLIDDSIIHIDQGKKMIPGRRRIPPTKDSHPRILPGESNCNIEQIAVYTDGDEELHIVGEIWEKLSNVHRAGLLVHEALYRTLRGWAETDSDNARKTVGYLFAGLKFTWVMDGVPLERFLTCWTEGGDFQFVAYPQGNRMMAQFLVYDGQTVLTKTAVPVDNQPFAKLFGLSASSWVSNGVLINVKNPLLERPMFYFDVNYYGTSNVTASMEAVSRGAGKNTKKVMCNPQLTRAEVFKGGASLGPAQ